MAEAGGSFCALLWPKLKTCAPPSELSEGKQRIDAIMELRADKLSSGNA